VLCTPIQLVVRGQGKRALHAARSQHILATRGHRPPPGTRPRIGQHLAGKARVKGALPCPISRPHTGASPFTQPGLPSRRRRALKIFLRAVIVAAGLLLVIITGALLTRGG
jgi:hypothetical protein